MQSLSLVMSECFLSGRVQGHVSNFYIVDLENFTTTSRWYTGDIHNSTVVGLFMTHCLQLNFQLHTIGLVRTCRISIFCTVACNWQDYYWQDASRGNSAIAELLVSRRQSTESQSFLSCNKANIEWHQSTNLYNEIIKPYTAVLLFWVNSTDECGTLNIAITAVHLHLQSRYKAISLVHKFLSRKYYQAHHWFILQTVWWTNAVSKHRQQIYFCLMPADVYPQQNTLYSDSHFLRSRISVVA